MWTSLQVEEKSLAWALLYIIEINFDINFGMVALGLNIYLTL
jgi:hypothetical protein